MDKQTTLAKLPAGGVLCKQLFPIRLVPGPIQPNNDKKSENKLCGTEGRLLAILAVHIGSEWTSPAGVEIHKHLATLNR